MGLEGEKRDRRDTNITKYIRWTMKLKRNTAGHTLRKETERRKIEIDAIKRAVVFDIKMSRAGKNTWERICLNQIRKREEEK